MLLFFFGYILAALPGGVGAPGHSRTAAVSLSLGLLTRYEVWIFASILAIGAIVRRRVRQLTIMLPGLIVICLWIVSAPLRTYHPAPLQLGPTFRTELLDKPLPTIESLASLILGQLIHRIHQDWTLAGLALFLVGIWCFREYSDWRGRELAIAAAASLVLAIILGFNSLALTSRMMLPFFALGIPYLAVGFAGLSDRLPRRWRSLVFWTIVGLFSLRGAVTGLVSVRDASLQFKPEHTAASVLEKLPRDASVEIRARTIPNPWEASAATAIFGNSLILNPLAERWHFSDAGAEWVPETEFVLYWDGTEYHLASTQDVDPGAVPFR